jgi:hypothetical protein
MASTAILKCFCEHEFQDHEYGSQKRLHNKMKKDNEWRCTVCGKTQFAGGGGEDKKKKGGKEDG